MHRQHRWLTNPVNVLRAKLETNEELRNNDSKSHTARFRWARFRQVHGQFVSCCPQRLSFSIRLYVILTNGNEQTH